MKYLFLLIVNTVPVVCLTCLAIHFDKWWIALFALLFGVSYKSTNKDGDDNETD